MLLRIMKSKIYVVGMLVAIGLIILLPFVAEYSPY
jgi:hypothetical protein